MHELLDPVRRKRQFALSTCIYRPERLESRLLLSADSVDPTFSPATGGVVNLPFVTEQVLQLNDGSIVAIGHQGSGVNSQGVLEELNSDGSINSNFGVSGIVTTTSGNEVFNAGAIDPTSGKIVAVGQLNGNFLVARFNTDGSPDTTFGIGGIQTDVAGTATTVVVEPSGTIDMGGLDNIPGQTSGFVVKQFDQFGDISAATVSLGDYAQQFLLDGRGRILSVFADPNPGDINDVMIDRGSLNFPNFDDPTFGSGGTVDLPGLSSRDPNGNAAPVAIAFQGVNILITGEATSGGLGIARLTANGRLDKTFGAGGLSTVTFGGGASDHADAISVDPSTGAFVLIGSSVIGGAPQTVTAAFNADGSPNVSFGDDGKLIVPAPPQSVSGASLSSPRPFAFHPQNLDFSIGFVDSNSRAVVGGSSNVATAIRRTQAITPACSLQTVPSIHLPTTPLVAGQKIGPITLNLKASDIVASSVSGPVSVAIDLSTLPAGDATDINLGHVSRKITVKPGRTAALGSVTIRSLPPSLASGTYYLIARLTDPAGGTNLIDAGSITIVAPFDQVNAVAIAAPPTARIGKRLSVSLTIIQNGNIPLAQSLPVELFLSQATVLDSSAIDLGPSAARASVHPGKRGILHLTATIPASVAAGMYHVIAQIDPNNTLVEPDPMNEVVVSLKAVKVS